MFTLKLALEDGTPADPPTLTAAVPNWKAGDDAATWVSLIVTVLFSMRWWLYRGRYAFMRG